MYAPMMHGMQCVTRGESYVISTSLEEVFPVRLFRGRALDPLHPGQPHRLRNRTRG